MPRSSYKITEEDLEYALKYLSSWELPVLRGSSSTRAKLLQDWCASHLTKLEWERLKSAIRQRRRRQTQKMTSLSVRHIVAKAIRQEAMLQGKTIDELLFAKFVRRK